MGSNSLHSSTCSTPNPNNDTINSSLDFEELSSKLASLSVSRSNTPEATQAQSNIANTICLSRGCVEVTEEDLEPSKQKNITNFIGY